MIYIGRLKLDILKLTIAIQLMILGFMGLSIINKINEIHSFLIILIMIQKIIILIYLLLIPGLLVLKILRIEACHTTTILFSIGISIALITFLSTFASIFLAPYYNRPLSKIPLTLLLLLFSTFLLILAWRKSKDLTITINISRLHLLLLCLPILMIICKTNQSNYFLTSIILITISLLPLITIFYFNKKYYSFIVWSISSSLAFNWLIFETRFNMRYDDITPCIREGIITAGIWDPTYPITHNSLLVPTIFPTIFSTLSDIDIVIGTRIIVCIITSLIPVVTYQIFKYFFNHKISFLASCLYAFYPFYPKLIVNSKTSFAFFFVSLLVLLILNYSKTNSKINKLAFNILLTIFTFSIVTSHYGTTYMFIFILLTSLILLYFKKEFTKNLKFNYNLLIKYVIFIFIFTFLWYLYTSDGANFGWGVYRCYHILTHLQDFYNPEESVAVRAFITSSLTPSLSLEATKWLLFMLFIFIIIGAIKIFYLYIKNKINVIYTILTLSFCSALAGITQMGMPRIFGFSLLLTAPLGIMGLSEILRVIGVKGDKKHLLAFSIYLFILFAFTYGFVANSINTITGEVKDMALYNNIKETFLKSDNIYFKRLIYWSIYLNSIDWGWKPYSTYKAVEWFFIHQCPNEVLFVDSLILYSYLFTLHLPREYGGKIVCNLTQPNVKSIEDVLKGNVRVGYVFLAYHNLYDNFIYITDEKGKNEVYYRTSNYKRVFEKMNKIYDSSGGAFYIAS